MTNVITNQDLLGEIVSWDMHGQEVAYDQVVDALDKAGLDPDAAQELSTRSAFTRACKHLKENRAIDKIESKGGVASFQFTKKWLEDGRFEHDYEARVEVDCDSGDVTCDENDDLAKQAKELLDYAMQVRTAQDITRIVQKMFKDHADLYAINKKGSAYFCPEKFRDFSAKVEQFITAMGGTMSRFPVPKGTEEGNSSVREAVSSGLNQMLEELSEAVEGWDDTTREKTMERIQERYESVSYKIECYRTYLGGVQEELRDQLKQSKSRMIDRMVELHEEPEAETASA